MFGFARDEVIGNRAPHIPSDGRASYEVRRARVLHGERFSNVPVTRRRKDGSIARCQLSVAPLETGNRIVGTVATIVEV
jgi:PAS domain S-box-containing protein